METSNKDMNSVTSTLNKQQNTARGVNTAPLL